MQWDAREHETQQQNYPRLVYPLTSRRCRRFVFFGVYTRPIYWHTRARLNTQGLKSPKRKKNTEICFWCREEATLQAGFDYLWVYHDKVGIGTESNVCVPPSPPSFPLPLSPRVWHRITGVSRREDAPTKKKKGSQCILKPRRRQRSFKLNFRLAAEGSGGGVTLRVSRGRVRLRRALFTLKGHRGWGVITRQHYYLFFYFFPPLHPLQRSVAVSDIPPSGIFIFISRNIWFGTAFPPAKCSFSSLPLCFLFWRWFSNTATAFWHSAAAAAAFISPTYSR